MERTKANLSVALREINRDPRGHCLAMTEGNVNGLPFDVTVTEYEMHFAFADRAGPSFSVSLNDIARQATTAIELLITGKSPFL